MLDKFFTCLIENYENDYLKSNLIYIDTQNQKGIYTSDNMIYKDLYIFGDNDIVYEYLDFFNSNNIIISETYINYDVFENVINYCMLQDKDINITLDNSISFPLFKKYVSIYNLNIGLFYVISIKNKEIKNNKDEKIIKFKVRHPYIDYKKNQEIQSFLVYILK